MSGKGSGRAVGLCSGGLEEAPGFSSGVGRLLGKRDGGAAKESKKLEAQGIVECPGWVSAKQRTELFEQSSIFVLPTWFEGQPVSLLEAMAAGMCSLTTAVGGIPQTLGEPEWNSLPTGKDGCGVMVEAKTAGC